MSEKRLSKIPFWDGKSKNFGAQVSKIEAYAEFVGIGNALDPILMENYPTWLEFMSLDIIRPDN